MDSKRLLESNDVLHDGAALNQRLRRGGYLFFRDLLPKKEVLALRLQIAEICGANGWLKEGTEPADTLTDHEPISEAADEFLPVYEQVQKLESFHRLKLHENMRELMERIFDEPVVALPNTVGRIAFPRDNQNITQPHQDWLYIQGSMDTLTAWVPLGDVPEQVGGLQVLEGSHKTGILFPRKATGPGGHTVEVDPTLHWASTDFRAGDVLVFNSLTIHGARPNLTQDQLRLSMDFRYVGQSHAVCTSNLPPHYYWKGNRFTWDALDSEWQDESLKRYWEKGPALKTVALDGRLFNAA